MSLTQFLRILWVWRWTILIATLGCFLAGALVTLVRPRTYTAEARVMLDVLKPDPVTGDVISSAFARAYVPTQTELIRDYRVAGRVVDRLGWTNSPAFKAGYDASDKHGVDFRRWLAEQVSKSVSAADVPGSNIIVISYTTSDPQTAAKMADLVRDAYIEETIASRRNEAAQNATWFERQLGDVRDKLTGAEGRMIAFERANNIVLLNDNSDADSARLQALTGQVPMPTISGGGGAPSPEAGQLAAIDAKIAAASATLGPNHPILQDLRQQRAAIAASARSSGVSRPVITSGGGDVAGARAKVLAQRDKVETAKRLQSDVQVLRDQYSKMAARAADLRQEAASSESGITLMDSAIPPRDSDPPKSIVILGGALGAGLALGILIALFIELLYRRVRGVEDLRHLGVPVVGVVHAGAAA